MILRLLLGDQLNYEHPWFNKPDDNVIYTLMEMRQETDYVRHHAQKILGFFAAMRQFDRWLRKKGHRTHYLSIDDPNNRQELRKNLAFLIKLYKITEAEYLEPDEYRLDKLLSSLSKPLGIPVTMLTSEHFFTTREELSEFFAGKKTYLMESFYRYMRRKHYVLMEGEEPVGGEWNFDKENRSALPKDYKKVAPLVFEKDLTRLWSTVTFSGVESFGFANYDRFHWPASREESLALLDFFLEYLLPHFGKFQDAMSERDWSLFHSRLSFALNTKMLSPDEVVHKTAAYWKAHKKRIPLPAVEGFIRQILGWREYMRGVYWAQMPEYKKMNYFNHKEVLPAFYWTGETRMHCLSVTIQQSLQHAYAHHIQRLMITGNFALLAGIHPDKVDEWYLGIYIDAVEWVEMPNTRGMSQFADGGLVATKPYVSSGQYIGRMSNYCQSCFYNKNVKYGEKACPFNSLYWHFHARHRQKLEKNPRIGMIYKTFDKMEMSERSSILSHADKILGGLNKL
ncbi:MAG: cryptochrome/photolyase family protein [Ignavibacteriaceae bacterium]|nr:cryptochrome/photolyase family protein [Ignavibacteriaceae bacterium]